LRIGLFLLWFVDSLLKSPDPTLVAESLNRWPLVTLRLC